MLYPLRNPAGMDLGLLLMRLTGGIALAWHGVLKFRSEGGWTHWMGSEDVFPAWAQAVAAVAEASGGAGIAVGFLTPLAAIGVMSVMGGAVYMHTTRGDPYVSATGSAWEHAALLLTMGLLFLLVGPGRFSLDALFRRRGRGGADPGGKPREESRPARSDSARRRLETVRPQAEIDLPVPPFGPIFP